MPSNLKNKSKAHIIPQGTWGAFTRPDILDPMDPEFEAVYKRQAEYYYSGSSGAGTQMTDFTGYNVAKKVSTSSSIRNDQAVYLSLIHISAPLPERNRKQSNL